ncbi:MAG: peptide chain release factor N(5)-glutamine methyltransferase [Phascolarctobacterium sp.]|uniref:peptide chain release factor N(5)-glutamine methyltransferase n=1 Tax=Phascolarctobacterium sp. TaxID=2049039 RepID=UPI0025E54DB1|nr:peptide chain release factor N(5)-glutamine methyltransferase [Phascolarctobacterium sp.]MCC8158324.1 peptide chain release factor N(5)-glutamine methyltransferase [Phascolarctobacterium sp.]
MENRPLWTITRVLEWTKQYFANKGIENPRLDAEILLCAVLKCERITLYVHFDQPLSEEELTEYRGYVARRAQQEPLAYILGEKAFMKHSFKVNPAVLVPRPETELLVESVAKAAAGAGAASLLDLGTGSGAIIVSLLELLPEAAGTAVDISAAALAVAGENAEAIGVSSRLTLVESDLFDGLPAGQTFDIIVSNPPYIPAADIAGLAADVQREPRGALDGGSDGLDFYRRIAAGCGTWLKPDGLLAFEVGIGQAQQVAGLCRQAGLTVTVLRKDYAEIERMVFATREGTYYADHLLEFTS